MRKFLLSVLAFSFLTGLSAQSFEGEIIYSNTYKSKLPQLSNQQLSDMIGKTQEYDIKGGEYKSVINGKIISWQLYINKENRLYNKMASSDTLQWYNGTKNTDLVLKSEINKGVTKILGYACDELILTCQSGVQKYYFNTKLSVDPESYKKHQFGNWNTIMALCHSLPLKYIIENKQFIIESEAIEIKPQTLDPVMFTIPPGSKAKEI